VQLPTKKGSIRIHDILILFIGCIAFILLPLL
jgi:hypothetical protein